MKKERKLRILWNSNAQWSVSGYGSQMAYLLPKIKDDGWIQAMIAFYGLEGGIIELNGIKTYSRIGDVWGADAIIHHGNDFKADVTITQQDIWVLDPNVIRQFRNWIPWLPVDHDPIPQPIVDRLKTAYRILAYSKFAHKQLADKGIHSTYMPLMVDTNIFKPLKDRLEIKKALGVPENYFLFGMVAANKDNPPRKSFQQAMDAFKLFHDKHPESAMYFHVNTQQPGGFPIDDYARFIGLSQFTYKPPVYDMLFKIGKPEMAKVYNTFDVLLAPSTNEGFGVPIIEAQACGVPVVTNNFTSMPELIIPGETGELCKVAYKHFSPLLSYTGIPDHYSIYEAMEKLFAADREKMKLKARLNVAQYDVDFVIKNHWLPFLELVQSEIYPNLTTNLT